MELEAEHFLFLKWEAKPISDQCAILYLTRARRHARQAPACVTVICASEGVRVCCHSTINTHGV